MSSQERRWLAVTWSYMAAPGGVRNVAANASEADAGRAARLVVGLEVLALREREHARQQVGGEALDLRVIAVHRVVVELAGVRDAALGAGQLLLELREVLVRLEVGVGLGQREQRLEGPGDHVLGLGLLRRALGVHARDTGGDHGLERLALVRGVAL